METGFISLIILLSLFALLGMYDGFYLHIFKFELFAHEESKAEHITHTVRGVLFPVILYCCYLTSTEAGFYFGLAVLTLDVIVTIVDAYMEKDSRNFMGGLPRWEYIVHLLVNGAHFAAIAVFIVMKVRVSADGVELVNDFSGVRSYQAFIWLVTNLIPGGVLMAGLHVMVAVPATARYWINFRRKIRCC